MDKIILNLLLALIPVIISNISKIFLYLKKYFYKLWKRKILFTVLFEYVFLCSIPFFYPKSEENEIKLLSELSRDFRIIFFSFLKSILFILGVIAAVIFINFFFKKVYRVSELPESYVYYLGIMIYGIIVILPAVAFWSVNDSTKFSILIAAIKTEMCALVLFLLIIPRFDNNPECILISNESRDKYELIKKNLNGMFNCSFIFVNLHYFYQIIKRLENLKLLDKNYLNLINNISSLVYVTFLISIIYPPFSFVIKPQVIRILNIIREKISILKIWDTFKKIFNLQ